MLILIAILGGKNQKHFLLRFEAIFGVSWHSVIASRGKKQHLQRLSHPCVFWKKYLWELTQPT